MRHKQYGCAVGLYVKRTYYICNRNENNRMDSRMSDTGNDTSYVR